MAIFPDAPKLWAAGPGVFAGWIPTVSGQLSFSVMGEGVGGCVRATAPTAPNKRIVVAIQRRVATDIPRPWAWSVWTWASANFVLIGETGPCKGTRGANGWTDPQGLMSGRILLLQQHAGVRRIRRNKLVDGIRRRIAAEQNGDVTELARWIYDAITARRTSSSASIYDYLIIPEASFVIYRTGEFRLSFDDKTLPRRFKDDSGEFIPDSETAIYIQDFREALASHFFYFVRDLTHRHYHHHPRSDSLLPILETSPRSDAVWRRETAYSLGRAALEVRREDDLLSYKKASGIVAYAQAFGRGPGAVLRDPSDYESEQTNPDQLIYDWDALLASISASADEESLRYSGRIQAFTAVLAAGLATVALWFAIAQVASNIGFPAINPKQPKGLLLSATSMLYSEPAAFTVIVLIFTWILFEFFGRGFRAFEPVQNILNIIKRFSYALAASISRMLYRLLPSAADHVGAYVSGTLSAVVMGLVFNLALALARRNIHLSALWQILAFCVDSGRALLAVHH